MTLKIRAERGTSQVFSGKEPEELFLASTNSVLPELSCLPEPMILKKAIEDIRQQAGHRFQPEMIKALMKFALKAEAGKKRRKKKPCWFLEDGISGKQYSITSQALTNSLPDNCLTPELFRAIWETSALSSTRTIQHRFTSRPCQALDERRTANIAFTLPGIPSYQTHNGSRTGSGTEKRDLESY